MATNHPKMRVEPTFEKSCIVLPCRQ